jgi:hypothetical protein
MERGRVNDLPRGFHAPLYLPSFGTLLGQYFVERFTDEYDFLLDRLESGSEVEQLCAFDLLDFLARHFYRTDAAIPDVIRQCAIPLPEQVRREVAAERYYGNQEVDTIGKLLSFDYRDEPAV